MQKFFFDVVVQSGVQYDFRGRDFDALDQARKLAELIALDIECIDGNEMAGKEVQVRNISGQRLFSVQIREPELIAA